MSVRTVLAARSRKLAGVSALLFAFGLAAGTAAAAGPAPAEAAAPEAAGDTAADHAATEPEGAEEVRAHNAWAAAEAAMKRGPTTVPLAGQVEFAVPAGYGFVPKAEAVELMESMGNRSGDDFLGVVLPAREGAGNWLVTLNFEKEGYIKDDDAKDWDADELLKNLKEGTESANEFRVQQGGVPLEVTGWVEPPAYEKATHRLVWSAAAKDKGTPSTDGDTVNYNTYVLGREGYVSLNLITDRAHIEGEKAVARDLLAAVSFTDGKRYADFDKSTDRVAEYGLAALVGGVALKKLGLFAVMAAFAAKFAKLIGIAVFAGFAGLKKFFGGKTKVNLEK